MIAASNVNGVAHSSIELVCRNELSDEGAVGVFDSILKGKRSSVPFSCATSIE